MTITTQDVRNDLASNARLRAAINVGNVVLVQADSVTGEPKGISVELAREIVARLEVPINLNVYNAAGKVFEVLKRKVATPTLSRLSHQYEGYDFREGHHFMGGKSRGRGGSDRDHPAQQIQAHCRRDLPRK
jgi:hypothetical protein